MDRWSASREILLGLDRAFKHSNAHKRRGMDFGGIVLYGAERQFIRLFLESKELRPTDIGRELAISKAAVTQLVNRLEKKDILRRGKASGNNKEVVLSLTSRGQDIASAIDKAGEAEVMELLSLLRQKPDDQAVAIAEFVDWVASRFR